MPISDALFEHDTQFSDEDRRSGLTAEVPGLLRRAFGVDFHLVDGVSGNLLYPSADEPECDWQVRSELCREVVRRGQPMLIQEEEPFFVLAVPLAGTGNNSAVAVATLVGRRVAPEEDVSQPALLLGMDPQAAASWASRQIPWAPEAIERVARLVVDRMVDADRLEKLKNEAESISVHLASTYEEISLLYRLTQNLKISASDGELGQIALEWMQEVLPAKGLAIQLAPVVEEEEEADSLTPHARCESELLTCGDCPASDEDFCRLVEHLELDVASQPMVVNRYRTQKDDWPFEEIRQMVVVPLVQGENLFGWLAAFNHSDDAEFGTVEANLLSSIGTILGIHSGNIELYRQQSELLAGIVRALTSSIDAKDPYTCGHSDRVARISVRLAEGLGCDPEMLKTIYLSGLLHDIGKIGINDSVLRKPGRLTDSEYEHIKTHVTIGHKILQDLKTMDDVLPIVLHHHESWDGEGYPQRLSGEKIPLSARIVAVADAFDAMASDRPYRSVMPDEKIDEIFRSGAGKQWDPGVVDAFFRARHDIHQIVGTGTENIEIGLQGWT